MGPSVRRGTDPDALRDRVSGEVPVTLEELEVDVAPAGDFAAVGDYRAGAWVPAISQTTDRLAAFDEVRVVRVVVDDGVVTQLNVEAPGDFSVSSAEHMLGQM